MAKNKKAINDLKKQITKLEKILVIEGDKNERQGRERYESTKYGNIASQIEDLKEEKKRAERNLIISRKLLDNLPK